MGVNVVAKLSPGTRARDVATVAAILLGVKPIMSDIPSCTVEGISSALCLNPIDAYINLLIPGDTANPAAAALKESDSLPYYMDYFFEGGGQYGGPSLYPKSTAAKIALVKRLVEFFGGSADYNDCDDVDCNIYVERPADIHAEDGELWNMLQQRMYSVQPITQSEIDAAEKWAAYGKGE